MNILADARHAFRSLYKARGFSIAVILTLALGIGANTAMFTLLRGTLLRALPNRDGERLVYLRQSAAGAGQDNVAFSVPEITDYRSASKTLSQIAEYSPMTFTLVDKDAPVHVRAGVIPRQLIENVATLDEVRDATVAPRRLNALFIACFGALAMVIAMVGIAGVLAFSVSSRTNEIGIRMSLGADAGRVHRMVLGEGGALLIVGLVAGALGALAATRLLRGLLFNVPPHDPTTLAAVTLILGGVGVAACWLPAVRAARVDPAVALRAE